MEPEDLADYLLTDEVPEQLIIKDIPDAAQSFVDDNKQSLGKAYWMNDNFTTEGTPIRIASPIPNQELTKVIKTKRTKTDEEKTDIQNRWNERKLYNQVTSTENEIRMNKKFETGVVFDSIDKRGASYAVSFTKEECLKMKDGIMTHNHPRGWGYPENSLGRIGNSFSPDDIYLAVGWDLAEIRAVTPNYTFTMKRPEGGWNISYDELKKLIKKENSKLTKEFMDRVNNGTTTAGKASAVHYHTLWKRVSEKLGCKYSKAKTR